jgi:simple sugar transport system permease protein
MKNTEPGRISGPDLLAVLCAIVIAVCFVLLPWLRTPDGDQTGVQLLTQPAIPTDNSSLWWTALQLIPEAAVLSGLAGLLGLRFPSRRPVTAIVASLAGAFCLVYFGIFLIQTLGLVPVAGLAGFWIVLAVSFILLLQMLLRRPLPDGALTPVQYLQRILAIPTIQRVISRPEFGPFFLLVVEVIVFSLRSSTFLSQDNMSNLLAFTPELGMISLAMTLLLTAGEFDLSVGSVFGFTAVVMWTIYNTKGAPIEVGFVVAILVAIVIGFANGWLVTRLKIPSFLVTLGMLLIVRGTALYITAGFPQGTWKAQSPLVNILVGEIYVGEFRLYTSLLWFILFSVILGYVLTQSKAGNWIQASGGNAGSARARGVRVGRTKILLFILTAVLAAFAGITSSIRVSTANPNSGTGYELEIIAMVVIGGTALSGGRGTIIGTILGVFILRLMRNGIVMVGVNGLAYNIFIGAIILGMMALHSWLERRYHAGT